MLEEKGAEYRYREYRSDPLSVDEIRAVLAKLGVEPVEVLRRRDRAWKELDLTGEETAEDWIAHMAAHPTLLQRPIAVRGDRAVVGRPVERLLELLED